ncbi:DNA-binding response regulator [Micromonospora echinospora]|uniref:Two component transcriptional regulator, LuxR family n=1 Tax=Micromonospora echinospora TaxID=1877 RepID=A0A1C4XR58_MICEC|nr:response regulator transcription factor [Micromonospora echinospora]OZV78501.1 DNA-binding response regulator [Micromonospora echinospora]SCF10944.1 two component transcriptional regulator, LuxR family [Micromonospora echinospora]
MSAPIQVVVVDDHPVFRLGMTALLSTLDGIECVGEAADVATALQVVTRVRPSVVLMDLHFGQGSGVEATRVLTRDHPDVGVLVVTMLSDDASLVAAMRAGARGYLLKGASAADVERSIRAVASGDLVLGAAVAGRAALLFRAGSDRPEPFPQLTDREREILGLLARGLPNAGIAQRLGLSPKTVRNNVSAILVKLQVNSRAEAITAARDEGLGDPSSDGRRGANQH